MTKAFQLILLLLLVVVSAVAIGAFWGTDYTPWKSPPASPDFPFEQAAKLQTMIAANLDRSDLQVTVEKKPVQQETLAWTRHDYVVHLTDPALYTELVYTLSEDIYANGGQIFQTDFRSDKSQVALTIGTGSFITHTLLFTWDVTPVAATPAPAAADGILRVALVIDDLGANESPVHRLLELGEDFTFSILPHQAKSLEMATLLHERQKEIILHLPMEALNVAYAGKGALLVNMTADAMQRTLEQDLQAVPYAVGVNNHMGSRLTADTGKMQPILQTLQQRQLFFLDSRTTGASVAYKTARQMGIKTAERKIFLDYEAGYDYAKNQLFALAALAEKGKPVVAIGHPKSATLQALKDVLPEFKRRKIQIVRLSELVQ